jgi:hypothetical protein
MAKDTDALNPSSLVLFNQFVFLLSMLSEINSKFVQHMTQTFHKSRVFSLVFGASQSKKDQQATIATAAPPLFETKTDVPPDTSSYLADSDSDVLY